MVNNRDVNRYEIKKIKKLLNKIIKKKTKIYLLPVILLQK